MLNRMSVFFKIISNIPLSYYYILIAFPFLAIINTLISIFNNYVIKIDYSLSKNKRNGSPKVRYLLKNYSWNDLQKKWLLIDYYYSRVFEGIILYVPISFVFYLLMYALFPEVRN